MHSFFNLVFSILRDSLHLIVPAVVVCLAGILIFWLCYRKKWNGERKFPWTKALAVLCLSCWLVILVGATLFRPDSVGVSYSNLHFFRAWREAWNQSSVQGWLNVLLNVALFLPLGLLLPLLGRFFRKWYVTPSAGLLLSLIIETVQYFTCRGFFDVDDLFCNTLGTALGFCILMMLRSLICRAERSPKRAVYYAVFPLVFLTVLLGISGAYQLQKYGNLEDAPSFTANTRDLSWTLNCELKSDADPVKIYHMEPFTKKTAGEFGENFASRLGITMPEIDYYDNSTLYMNHSTGDFLMINYFDRSYDYSIGTPPETDFGAIEDPEERQSALREELLAFGITMPDKAEFLVGEGRGDTFVCHMIETPSGCVDGELQCHYNEDGRLYSIKNHMVTAMPAGTEPILSEEEAYTQLRAGKASPGEALEYAEESTVSVNDCRLEYRTDSKGFYRPVYTFAVCFANGDGLEMLVPAMQ